MTGRFAFIASLMLGAALPSHAFAQEDSSAEVTEGTAQQAGEGGSVLNDANREGARIFTATDFARFSPRNALDMIGQVPGFSIRGQDEARGLGQASANVLIDGTRVTSKSDSVFDRLRTISTDRVARIEIVEGATLGIAGLSGQVANVVTLPDPLSGRFRYRANYRPKYARPSYFGGEVSLSGTKDALEWTLSYQHGVNRGAAGGGIAYLTDPAGEITEYRDVTIEGHGEFPQLTGRAKWTSPAGTVVNANASYSRVYDNFNDDEIRLPVDGARRVRYFDNSRRGDSYEIGADVTFGLGPGKLKLIGQDSRDHRRYGQDFLLDFSDDTVDVGNRYRSHVDTGERIGRGEYSWAMMGGDWQLDAEAAFNRLDTEAQLFERMPDGNFDEIPFPDGTGGVREDRYEAILNHSRKLSDSLSLQLAAGGEYSTISQTGSRGLTRSFWRPKGSANLAWAAGNGFDISAKLARTVGQLSFGDFLASVSLQQDNEDAGNIELVPPQSWDADLEVKKDLGRFGSTTVKLYGRWYEDFIEIIPVADGLEANGNIDSARLYGVDWNTTFELAALGFKGAKIDATLVYEDTSLKDPLTGVSRPFSGQRDVRGEAQFRHDVPGSDFAWGLGVEYSHAQPYYRLGEVSLDYEGPAYTYGFLEHKDVLGMTAELTVYNLTGGKVYYERTVFDGYRDRSPVLFGEYRKLNVGPIFIFSLSGDF